MKRPFLPLSPTVAGIFWLLAVLALLATAINYGNNQVFALCFLLLALWLQAGWHCWRNLADLHWQPGVPDGCFAGSPLQIEGQISERAGRARTDITLVAAGKPGAPVSLPADGEAIPASHLPTGQRGPLSIGSLELASVYPLGLWRARYRLPELKALVYPAAEGEIPLPTDSPQPAHRQAAADDFQGVTAYAPGDSPRRINWRIFSRNETLMVNRFDGSQGGHSLWLIWENCTGDSEIRLAQLTRWVLDAEHAGHEYGLRLPGTSLPAARGRLHREKCLTRLALFSPDITGSAS